MSVAEAGWFHRKLDMAPSRLVMVAPCWWMSLQNRETEKRSVRATEAPHTSADVNEARRALL